MGVCHEYQLIELLHSQMKFMEVLQLILIHSETRLTNRC